MRQLVDHFQQTSYTPRNFNALLPTPRFAYSSSNFHAGGGCLDDIDPNCFEEGAVTFTSFSSNPNQHQHQRVSGEISLQSSDHTFNGGSRHPTGGEILARGVDRYREGGGWTKDDSNSTSSSCDAVQAYLDAPVNAAVNVALKCATREASFEEVLSWLASSNQSGFEYVPPAYGDSYAHAHHTHTTHTTHATHTTQGAYHGQMSSLSSAYHLM